MEPRSEDGQFEEVTVQQLPPVEHGDDKTVEIAVRLSPKQLDHVAPVLEEIIHEIAEKDSPVIVIGLKPSLVNITLSHYLSLQPNSEAGDTRRPMLCKFFNRHRMLIYFIVF
ncbi:hypothetical protein F2P81_012955 [Scophthalmus maximus]|uniref:Uncharacterized protein n=1 Tax=Scophthalmus maximus TaxID=52904 RepID=A0A6A4SPL8_SCOMX|nr:hypothetical protein F2P81_012955 [Scophthalmus maximus]